MNASAQPSDFVRPTDTVHMTSSQRRKLLMYAHAKSQGRGLQALGLAFVIVCGLMTWMLMNDPLGGPYLISTNNKYLDFLIV